MMMTANLVGFVVGLDGIRYMLRELVVSSQGRFADFLSLALINECELGAQFTIAACFCLFVAVQVMFEYRLVFDAVALHNTY